MRSELWNRFDSVCKHLTALSTHYRRISMKFNHCPRGAYLSTQGPRQFPIADIIARSSLQSHSGLISNNLQAVAKQLTDNQQLLSSIVAYPLPQYPSAQAHLLEHLLRTKLEPEVEEWVEKGLEIAPQPSQRSSSALSQHERDELWQWAPVAANDEIRKQNWGGDYSMAEKQAGVENVATGLKRELVEPPDPDEHDDGEGVEESEEGDYDEEDVQIRRKPNVPGLEFDLSTTKRSIPQMPIENVFRFMLTGNTAPGRPP
jgi:mediator of RNA polymerase II transcription subunit 8, fungi type